MQVYMTHPQHGAMHVYAQWQLEDNLKRGWVLDVEPWRKEQPEAQGEPVKRRGRPPKV